MDKLTNKEIQFIDTEYGKHKYGNICPHTINPRQLKALCQRCRKLDILHISVYQMPVKLGGDWAAHFEGDISDGFKSRAEAEEWALNKAYPIKNKQVQSGHCYFKIEKP